MIKTKNIENEKVKQKKKELQIIGQGGYGCVFRPEIQCNTLRPGSRKYVSKVQLSTTVSDSESKIGSIIQTIPHYSSYFAPVLENCPLSIKTIETYKINESCKDIKEEFKYPSKNTSFISSKIQYVGETDLGDYINHLLLKCTKKSNKICSASFNWHSYIKKHIYSHLYLLRSTQKLSEKGIVHMDIKSNNIIYDNKNNHFVAIDFGISVLFSDIETSTYEMNAKKPFGISASHYIPWCIDIMILSYIARQIKLDNPNPNSTYVDSKKFNAKPTSTSIEEMKAICLKYATSLNIFIDSQEKEVLIDQLHKWVQDFSSKTYKDIWTLLIANYKTWDNYSICAMYLYEWVVIGIYQDLIHIENKNIINIYLSKLKSVLLSLPNKRDDSSKTYDFIVKLFSKIKKSQYNIMVEQFSQIISSPEKIQKIKEAHQQRKINDLQIEHDFYHQK